MQGERYPRPAVLPEDSIRSDFAQSISTTMVSVVTAILLLSLAAVSVDAIRSVRGPSLDAPDFCHDADCPKFTMKEKRGDYEIREYEKGVTRQSTRRTSSTSMCVTVYCSYVQ